MFKKIGYMYFFFYSIELSAHPFLTAIKNGDFRELSFQMVQRPDLINIKDKQGDTILHYIAKNGEILSFLTLVSHPKTLMNEKNNEGQTPKDVALNFGQIRIVHLFDYFLSLREK